MQITLKPEVEALLLHQVAAGYFASVDDALHAAVLGLPMTDPSIGDLTWALPSLAIADAAIARGETVAEAEAFVELERRYGAL
jgi:Arc/MetJ-type ribon-helix-helix transcriptional regulator